MVGSFQIRKIEKNDNNKNLRKFVLLSAREDMVRTNLKKMVENSEWWDFFKSGKKGKKSQQNKS